MYTPPAFQEKDVAMIFVHIRAARLANFITSTREGLLATPLPMFLDETEGANGVLYGHLARANTQWKTPCQGEALAIFMGPDAYVTPSWYQTKRDTGKVVPTWNYVTVHAYGAVEFFDDTERLLDVVKKLTHIHEHARPEPWAVSDAPEPYIQSQLKGIVGLRMTISRLEGKRKMSQNRSDEDRAGVSEGLAASNNMNDQVASRLILG
jgi:transcriptional regulator